jgi:hypothetical protein
MITARETGVAIFGAWRLARFDAGGLQFFENTVEAFWRSFYAALVVLPIYVIMFLMRSRVAEITSGPFAVFVVESIAYVIAWTAFPLAMFYLARHLGRSKSYCRYIAAYNWAAVLQITLLVTVSVIVYTEIVPRGVSALLSMAAMIAIMSYQWFIARAALEVTPAVAVGIVLLDLFISILIDAYARNLL